VALITEVGLEDAGEIVSLMTTPQLEAVFDDDLWARTRTGERFDPGRFGLWLEVMVEIGADKAAAVVADLFGRDPAVVVHGLAGLVSVFDLDELALRGRRGDDDIEAFDDLVIDRRSHETDHFFIVATDDGAFDAVTAIVDALDQQDIGALRRLLERLAAITAGAVETHGIEAVLSEGESAAEDAIAARDDRRGERGFVPVADARAFLALARQGTVGDDAITRAWLPPFGPGHSARVDVPARTASPTTLLAPGAAGSRPTLRRQLAQLDGPTLARRQLELAWLANVVVAATGGRPVDAATLVVDVVDEALAAAAAAQQAHTDLVDVDCVVWFGRGYRLRGP
jgi:Family of unknown function (DUF6178)